MNYHNQPVVNTRSVQMVSVNCKQTQNLDRNMLSTKRTHLNGVNYDHITLSANHGSQNRTN